MEQFSYDDIQPVTLNEEQPQLCQILYDDDYKYTMGTLLAMMAKNEYSHRALALSETALTLLASHYSIWIYRYDIVKFLNKDLIDELSWCETIALDNEKNYQIWNYRQLLINEILNQKLDFNPYHEFPIIAAMLDSDSKNHHVWSYRKWLVEKFNLHSDSRELDLINEFIDADVRNNSAWSHRFFLKFKNTTDTEVIDLEIEYTKSKIIISPQNASSWNYLRGIYDKYQLNYTNLTDFVNKFINLSTITPDNINQSIKSIYALELLAQINQINEKYKDSVSIYKLLSSTYDPIRKNYWQYLISKINQKVELQT